MIVLGIDCATNGCGAALWREGVVLSARHEPMDRGQAESLIPMIVSVMNGVGVGFAEIDRVAVTVGPGSFTGVRVGLAAARAIGLAADKPVLGITTTEAVAHAVPEFVRRGALLLTVIESRRSEPYHQLFSDDLRPLTQPSSAPLESLADLLGSGTVLVAGDGVHLLPALEAVRWRFISDRGPDAGVVAAIAAGLAQENWMPADPLYVRPPDLTASATPGDFTPHPSPTPCQFSRD
ncbi:MAG: tRNA (adenosine(37)-N6)-threonylcarbamoyltransferase complex dimerization subunit type 1 TsaB [Alphaproteobacteria bacterium]